MDSIIHFGVVLKKGKYGFNLTKDNYAIVSNKSSFTSGNIYSDEWCREHYERCICNFEKNMNYFSSLDKEEFDSNLNKFLERNDNFIEIDNLDFLEGKSGYYIMVLDNYKQVYIGNSHNIKERIITHWRKRVPFDRLIFGSVENSIISIDSFRALDTTRIFAFITDNIYELENKFIDDFSKKYVLNRTKGGRLENGINEAIINRKTRDFEENKLNNINKDKYYTIADLMKILRCSRYKIMKYYDEQNLPLIKKEDKYIINKYEFKEWLQKKREEEEREEFFQFIIITVYMLMLIVCLIFIFYSIIP